MRLVAELRRWLGATLGSAIACNGPGNCFVKANSDEGCPLLLNTSYPVWSVLVLMPVNCDTAGSVLPRMSADLMMSTYADDALLQVLVDRCGQQCDRCTFLLRHEARAGMRLRPSRPRTSARYVEHGSALDGKLPCLFADAGAVAQRANSRLPARRARSASGQSHQQIAFSRLVIREVQ